MCLVFFAIVYAWNTRSVGSMFWGILRVLIYGDQKHEVVCFLLDVACILCINIDVLKNEDCIKVGKNFMTSSV